MVGVMLLLGGEVADVVGLVLTAGGCCRYCCRCCWCPVRVRWHEQRTISVRHTAQTLVSRGAADELVAVEPLATELWAMCLVAKALPRWGLG